MCHGLRRLFAEPDPVPNNQSASQPADDTASVQQTRSDEGAPEGERPDSQPGD